MNDCPELATAMLATLFTAALLLTGIAGVLYEPHQPHKAGWQDRSVSNLTFATCFIRFSSIRLDPC